MRAAGVAAPHCAALALSADRRHVALGYVVERILAACCVFFVCLLFCLLFFCLLLLFAFLIWLLALCC